MYRTGRGENVLKKSVRNGKRGEGNCGRGKIRKLGKGGDESRRERERSRLEMVVIVASHGTFSTPFYVFFFLAYLISLSPFRMEREEGWEGDVNPKEGGDY